MTNVVIVKQLKITGMIEDCPDMAAAPHDDSDCKMVLTQGDDTIWLDPEGARALGLFLTEWAVEE